MEPTPETRALIALVEPRLAELIATGPDALAVEEAMAYSLLAPGKRLRPVLAMASSAAVGGVAEAALDAGCAVEMVHCFSLIHDDLPAIDNDDLRRGRPTCHKVYGEAMAILAGDGLFARAFAVIAPSGTLAVAELARASGELVLGEARDILSEGAPANAATLQAIHAQKTGALFGAACAIGAICGGGAPGHVGQLRSYGLALGLAFQIADDVLNETSSAEVLGKAAGSDRELGKMTYPALFGLEESRRMALSARDEAIGFLAGLPTPTPLLADLAEYACARLS
ncbi:MAG: polyprenyl synthetase family protein [Chthonomonas sp.]|nr:polyprenyl synthetase family protein [Chthonomonas sp.]